MCGILGCISKKNNIPVSYFTGMLNNLAPRGPDGEGVEVLENGKVLFGHRRLSIIDLSNNGNQPMSNEDHSLWLVFNGEIYNYLSLKKELSSLGHVFRSKSDSEVIVHAYEEWGKNCVDHLNGIFAFGIWDSKKKNLFLARDRMGVKPLYYWKDSDCFVFSSQPSAILDHPNFNKEINLDAFQDYLALGYIPFDASIYEGINKLPAAHTLLVEELKLKRSKYWQVSIEKTVICEEDAILGVSKTIETSINDQTVSDVPVGLYLSGGIDSSTVSAVAAKKLDYKVRSFTVGFNETWNDERKYAKSVSEDINLDFHEETLSYEKTSQMFSAFVEAYDEPFFGGSAFPCLFISELTQKKGNKVILAGDGGDELFAGYLRYDTYSENLLKEHKTSDQDPVESYFRIPTVGIAQPEDIKEILTQKVQNCTNPDIFHSLRRFYREDLPPVAAACYMDLHTYLPDHILCKVDRASMAHGIEVRVPLLDHRLVEYASSVSPSIIYKNKERKFLMKKAVEKWVPKEILNGRKKGFSIPLNDWMKHGFTKAGKKFVTDGSLISRGILNASKVENIFNSDNGKLAWLILSAELWARRWMDNDCIADRLSAACRL